MGHKFYVVDPRERRETLPGIVHTYRRLDHEISLYRLAAGRQQQPCLGGLPTRLRGVGASYSNLLFLKTHSLISGPSSATRLTSDSMGPSVAGHDVSRVTKGCYRLVCQGTAGGR